MKIKVMHVLHKLAVAGAENGVVNLVNRLDMERFSPEIVTFVPGGELAERLDRAKVTLIERLHKCRGNDWRLPIQLSQILRERQPHIVHTHGWGTLCETWLALRFSPAPIWIHGEHGTMQEKSFNKPIQRFLWHRTDAVLAVSARLRKRLSATLRFPLAQIQVIQNGVDVDCFCPGLEMRHLQNTDLRRELELTHDPFVVGIVGRLEPVKDHHTFIEAIARLYPNQSNVVALIVGEGSQHPKLKRLAAQLGIESRVRFLGRRDDVVSLLHLMDAFVLCSRSEGMSNTILEAMACGLPVVATAVGGNPELVAHESTGILVPPQDAHALAQALWHLYQAPTKRRQLGLASRARVESHFSLERMVQNYEDLYIRLSAARNLTQPVVQPEFVST